MKISIVTISYNQKQYLKACMDSILTQTGCELEYIVVDAGSTDGSRELIEFYGDRVIKVFERDDGPADGLNKGFARATGDVYGFINSDDYLLPGALKRVTEFFLAYPHNAFMTGYGFTEDEFAHRTPIRPSVLTQRAMLHRAAVMFQQTTFFTAEQFKIAGGFNQQNRTCWDYELFLNLLQHQATHYVVKEELAVFRLYQGSISGSGRLEQKYFKELDDLFIKYTGRSRSLLDQLFSFYLRVKRELLRRVFGRKC
jgi:glycosyltransferase involved in cell wall biosynthesis